MKLIENFSFLRAMTLACYQTPKPAPAPAERQPLAASVSVRGMAGGEHYGGSLEVHSYGGGYRVFYIAPMRLTDVVFTLESEHLRFVKALKGQSLIHDGPALCVTLASLEPGTQVELSLAPPAPVQMYGHWRVLP